MNADEATDMNDSPGSGRHFPFSSEFSQSVLMLVAVTTAVVAFSYTFMNEGASLKAEAQALRYEQQTLREFASQIANQVNANTMQLSDLNAEVNNNTGTLEQIDQDVKRVQFGIQLLICLQEGNPSDQCHRQYNGNSQ